METNNRKQLQQKTEFNSWNISMLNTISKCKKNNNIIKNAKSQKCIFCGNPNYT